MAKLADRIIDIIAASGGDGIDEAGLAQATDGDPSALDQVSDTCEALMGRGEIVRRGAGTDAEPYTYHLPEDGTPRL